MVELVRGGRSAGSLSKEFGPTSWSIALWVKQAQRDVGKGDGGLATPEREELARLLRGLEAEEGSRRSSQKPQTGSRRAGPRESALRVREGKPGHPLGRGHVPIAADFEKRLLCVAGATHE